MVQQQAESESHRHATTTITIATTAVLLLLLLLRHAFDAIDEWVRYEIVRLHAKHDAASEAAAQALEEISEKHSFTQSHGKALANMHWSMQEEISRLDSKHDAVSTRVQRALASLASLLSYEVTRAADLIGLDTPEYNCESARRATEDAFRRILLADDRLRGLSEGIDCAVYVRLAACIRDFLDRAFEAQWPQTVPDVEQVRCIERACGTLVDLVADLAQQGHSRGEHPLCIAVASINAAPQSDRRTRLFVCAVRQALGAVALSDGALAATVDTLLHILEADERFHTYVEGVDRSALAVRVRSFVAGGVFILQQLPDMELTLEALTSIEQACRTLTDPIHDLLQRDIPLGEHPLCSTFVAMSADSQSDHRIYEFFSAVRDALVVPGAAVVDSFNDQGFLPTMDFRLPGATHYNAVRDHNQHFVPARIADPFGPRYDQVDTAWRREEVAQRNNAGSLWLIINRKVYDLTRFHRQHPGGEAVRTAITAVAGVDATEEAQACTANVHVWESLFIGDVLISSLGLSAHAIIRALQADERFHMYLPTTNMEMLAKGVRHFISGAFGESLGDWPHDIEPRPDELVSIQRAFFHVANLLVVQLRDNPSLVRTALGEQALCAAIAWLDLTWNSQVAQCKEAFYRAVRRTMQHRAEIQEPEMEHISATAGALYNALQADGRFWLHLRRADATRLQQWIHYFLRTVLQAHAATTNTMAAAVLEQVQRSNFPDLVCDRMQEIIALGEDPLCNAVAAMTASGLECFAVDEG